jgi:hypothetical protein
MTTNSYGFDHAYKSHNEKVAYTRSPWGLPTEEMTDEAVRDRLQSMFPAPQQGIGDVNSKAKGSGARYNTGKPDYSLIPLNTLEDEVRVWMYGKDKYAAFNWMKGMAWSVPFACALRHLTAWQRGEQLDPESGLPHLAHVMCNIRMLTLYEKTYPEGDDRPPQEFMP